MTEDNPVVVFPLFLQFQGTWITLYAMHFHWFLPHERIQSLDECGVLRQGTAELPVVREDTFFFVLILHPTSLTWHLPSLSFPAQIAHI